jgi:hypothetical protein
MEGTWAGVVGQLAEQLASEPEFKGSNPVDVGTGLKWRRYEKTMEAISSQ